MKKATKQILNQVASLVRANKIVVRIEVHVPLGTRSKNKRRIARQRSQDLKLSRQRAQAIRNYLVSRGVSVQDIAGAIGFGSQYPIKTPESNAKNARVDFIKAIQKF